MDSSGAHLGQKVRSFCKNRVCSTSEHTLCISAYERQYRDYSLQQSDIMKQLGSMFRLRR